MSEFLPYYSDEIFEEIQTAEEEEYYTNILNTTDPESLNNIINKYNLWIRIRDGFSASHLARVIYKSIELAKYNIKSTQEPEPIPNNVRNFSSGFGFLADLAIGIAIDEWASDKIINGFGSFDEDY